MKRLISLFLCLFLLSGCGSQTFSYSFRQARSQIAADEELSVLDIYEVI